MKRFKTFWRKQFGAQATRAQIVFDVFFGILLPLACFYFDPIVFKSNIWFGEPILSGFKPFAYLLSFVALNILGFWIFYLKNNARIFNAAFAGLFFTGGVFALLTGVVLLPFSLIGLLFVVGVLGFTPFFTAFVYLRNGIRAIVLVGSEARPALVLNTFILSVTLSFIFPIIFNLKINQTITEMAQGDVQTINASAERLRFFSFFINLDKIVRAYGNESNIEQKAALAAAYREITGEDIERRLSKIND